MSYTKNQKNKNIKKDKIKKTLGFSYLIRSLFT